ncbi:hypothetical protein ALI144C_42580 [Actinosynnema sp. ALI-1.44]|uniref:hypothetical protein n=1 Tax=Actinosynnema sp. ALI-1.44 TaxID=1933779 RepID=UPI00097C980A|nr:hypothetical protein [Actinosynnema sp. ALI-1.44]ONI72704.1 hypothetical protein ALI144C_42580 [Actinosynnema sp. ALI-1.44]
MAKNMLPMKPGGGIMGKLITAVIGLALIMLVVKYPSDVASWVTGAGHILTGLADGLVTFFRAL